MRTNLSKKQRNEKVRQMVRELAYFSAIGKKISRKELSLKHHVGNGVFTIAQSLGYIKKIRSGIYSVMVDFTDKIIDELYAAHAENTKASTKKNKPIEPHLIPQFEFNGEYYPLADKPEPTTVTVSEELYYLLNDLCELRRKAQAAEDLLRRLLILGEYTKRK